jgi:hypothetical protein
MGKDKQTVPQATLRQALMAGGLAGVAVDTALFPLGNNYIIIIVMARGVLSSLSIHRYHQNAVTVTGRLCKVGWFPWYLLWLVVSSGWKCAKW